MFQMEWLAIVVGIVALAGLLIVVRTFRMPKSFEENSEKLKSVRKQIRSEEESGVFMGGDE